MNSRTEHTAVETINKIQRENATKGLEKLGKQPDADNKCGACCDGKSAEHLHTRRKKQSREFLSLMHSDLIETIELESYNKYSTSTLNCLSTMQVQENRS